MNTISDELKELIVQQLIQDKRFLPLYKEYDAKAVELNRIVDRISGFIDDVDQNFIMANIKTVKEYIIYRLFFIACTKRLVKKFLPGITYIDPIYKTETIINDVHSADSFGQPYSEIDISASNSRHVVAKVQINIVQLQDFESFPGGDLLKYPVIVTHKHISSRSTKPAEIKTIGDITKSQILTWLQDV